MNKQLSITLTKTEAKALAIRLGILDDERGWQLRALVRVQKKLDEARRAAEEK